MKAYATGLLLALATIGLQAEAQSSAQTQHNYQAQNHAAHTLAQPNQQPEAPPGNDAKMNDWMTCIAQYARPQLKQKPAQKLVAEAMRSCAAQEQAVRQGWIEKHGNEQGEKIFAGLKQEIRTNSERAILKVQQQGSAR